MKNLDDQETTHFGYEKISKAVVELSRLKYGKPRQMVETETIERSNL